MVSLKPGLPAEPDVVMAVRIYDCQKFSVTDCATQSCSQAATDLIQCDEDNELEAIVQLHKGFLRQT